MYEYIGLIINIVCTGQEVLKDTSTFIGSETMFKLLIY